jgi:hypothetical protein
MVSPALILAAVPSFAQWMMQQGKSYATREETVLRRVSAPLGAAIIPIRVCGAVERAHRLAAV